MSIGASTHATQSSGAGTRGFIHRHATQAALIAASVAVPAGALALQPELWAFWLALGFAFGLTLLRGGAVRLPYIWLLIFFLAPFLIVLKISVSTTDIAMPPYTPLLEWGEDAVLTIRVHLSNFLLLGTDQLYWLSYLNSVKIAALSTALTLLIGYPMALGIARSPRRLRIPLLITMIVPFWTSFLIRVYAWIGILKQEGLLNQVLLSIGIIDTPLQILNTSIAVYIGIIYSYLPFMVLPLYATLERMDQSLIEAAGDLGCPPLKAFWMVTFPLSLPGVLAGSVLVFVPAVGEFVIPDLLGGSDTLMIGRTLWSEFFSNRDWPVAAAAATALLALLIPLLLLLQRAHEKRGDGF